MPRHAENYRTRASSCAAFVLAAVVQAGCNKPDADKAKAPDRFPGFTAAAATGPGASFLAELGGVDRRDGVVHFKLLRLLPKGYVLQNAATNCRGRLSAEAGVQYTDEGVSERAFPATLQAVEVNTVPGMDAVARMVCSKANEARSFAGEFEAGAALKAIHGAVNDQGGAKTGLWPKMDPPASMNLSDAYRGKDGIASVLLSHPFAKDGVQRQILLTATTLAQGDHDCHACGVLVGGATFVQTQGRWAIESEYPYMAELGAFGKTLAPTVMAAGTDRPLVVFQGSDMHQGIASTWLKAYLVESPGLREGLNLGVEGGRDGQQVALRIEALASTQPLADLKITLTRSGDMPGASETEQQIWRYDGSKFAALSPEQAAAALPAQPATAAASSAATAALSATSAVATVPAPAPLASAARPALRVAEATPRPAPITSSHLQGPWSGTFACGPFLGARSARNTAPFNVVVRLSVNGTSATWSRSDGRYSETLTGTLKPGEGLRLTGQGSYVQSAATPWTTRVTARLQGSREQPGLDGSGELHGFDGELSRRCSVTLTKD